MRLNFWKIRKGEKSNNFFLNLEKKRGIQGQIRKIIVNKKEISDEKRINVEIELFHKNLFTKCREISCSAHNIFKHTSVTYTK